MIRFLMFLIIFAVEVPLDLSWAKCSQVPKQENAAIVSFATDEGDERLSRSFSLEARAESLRNILQKLQKQSGVSFHIESEWIADVPTIAYTRPMPLYLLLRRLAHLHNLTWRSEAIASSIANFPASQRRYVLFESSSNKAYINKLKQLSWEPLRGFRKSL